MGYCKHQWEDRSEVLRRVFETDPRRREHDFFVCARCLKIDECEHGEHARNTRRRSDITAA